MIHCRYLSAVLAANLAIESARADDWSPLWCTARLSQPREDLAAASVGNKILFAGGWTGSDESTVDDIYDKSTDSWTTANLSQARFGLAATSAGGKVFFAGGAAQAGRFPSSNVVDIYDSTAGTWSTASLSQGRARLASASLGSQV